MGHVPDGTTELHCPTNVQYQLSELFWWSVQPFAALVKNSLTCRQLCEASTQWNRVWGYAAHI